MSKVSKMKGVFEKPTRRVRTVFIHCSASNHPQHDDISVIRKWHVQERGWRDVGYHYFITSGGEVQAGRPTSLRPAAQRGHNAGSIAICLHGLNAEDFTSAQFTALRGLCRTISSAYDGNVTFHGHCEVSPKACPVFDYKNVLKLDDEGHMHGKRQRKREAEVDSGSVDSVPDTGDSS